MGRAPETVQALRIDWRSSPEESLERLTRPTLVLVAAPRDPEMRWDRMEDVVFADLWVALGAKAFCCIRLTPEEAAEDALVSGRGRAVPRVLVADPVKHRVRVLEHHRVGARALYPLLRSTSDRFYEGKLDRRVRAHRDLLDERDRLYAKACRLRAKQDGASLSSGEESELSRLEHALSDLSSREATLWELTPRASTPKH